VRWRIRPYAPTADREWAHGLWAAAMPSSWPVLPAGIAMIADGLVAEAGAGPEGLAALDLAGSVSLILVHPGWRDRRIGTGLLAAALDLLRAGGARQVTAGNGGSDYIWPGVPWDRHCPGHPGLADPLPGGHPGLPYRLGRQRGLLPPGRLPALAAICHVPQPRLATPQHPFRLPATERSWPAAASAAWNRSARRSTRWPGRRQARRAMPRSGS